MLWYYSRRWSPDGSTVIADIIYTAFGFGFSLANFRLASFRYRWNASIFTLIYGCLIAYMALFAASIWNLELVALGLGGVWVVGLVPIVVILHRRAARLARRKAGVCDVCGYDLRGSREFGRCPECGTAIA